MPQSFTQTAYLVKLSLRTELSVVPVGSTAVRQGAGQQEADLIDGQSGSQVLKLDAQVDQEVMGQNRERHMVMPTEPTAQFVVVKTDLALAFLEENLDRPTQPTESHQFGEGQAQA